MKPLCSLPFTEATTAPLLSGYDMRPIVFFLIIHFSVSLVLAAGPQVLNIKTISPDHEAVGWTSDQRAIRLDKDVIGYRPTASGGYLLIRIKAAAQFQISWYNPKGALQGSSVITLPEGYSLPEILPSQNGERALSANVDNGLLTLTDNRGREISRFPVTDNYNYNSENILLTRATNDLSIILNGVTTFSTFDGSPLTQIIARTADNRILFKKSFKAAHLRSIALSPSGRNFALCLYTQNPLQFRSMILDKSGQILFENNQRSRRFAFDAFEKQAAFIDKNALSVIDMQKRGETGSMQLHQAGRIIIAGLFTNSGELILQTATVKANSNVLFPWAYRDNRFMRITKTGNIRQEISLGNIEVLSPSLWEKDNRLYLGHSAGLLEITPVQKK